MGVLLGRRVATPADRSAVVSHGWYRWMTGLGLSGPPRGGGLGPDPEARQSPSDETRAVPRPIGDLGTPFGRDGAPARADGEPGAPKSPLGRRSLVAWGP